MSLASVLGRVLFAAAALVGALPLSWARALGGLAGRAAWALNIRETRIARRNLELIHPQWSAAQREVLVGEILRATGRNLLETLRVWTRSRAANLRLVRQVHGRDLFEQALADGRGLIVAAPHHGNWELLAVFLASRAPLTLVFRVPEKKSGEAFLRLARRGPNLQLVAAEANAMRPLWKAVKSAGMAIITPDQQPKLGSGEFAPFFGRQALTPSLIPRLAERSGAPVLFAWAEPVPGGFDIHFESGDPTIAAADLAAATAALNAQVEAIARRDLRQYQWTYKRWSKRPRGAGETNPYKPDCY